MKTSSNLLLLLLVWAFPFTAQAQTDTLRSHSGGVVPVTIHSFGHQSIQVDRYYPDGKKRMSVPYSILESVRFADGFEVRFQDGELVRDNLFSAPKLRSRLWSLQAEDAIDLTQSEIRQYYGDRLYNLTYRPYKNQLKVGLIKALGGLAGYYIADHRDPAIWTSSFHYSSDPDPYNEVRVEESEGDLYVGWIAAKKLFMAAHFTGLLDSGISLMGLKTLYRRHETMKGPSLEWAKTEFWGGIALTAAGVGAMSVFASRLNDHCRWVHKYGYSLGQVWQDVHEGEPASKSDLNGLFWGALAVNLGVSAIQMGQARISGFRKLDGTPYAMQVDLGPAPYGYGLTVRF